MTLGIMQPYLFPYIGYFQLVHAVDTFVIYDDVQYITRGWINRNRILQNGEPNLYTFSLQSDSSRKNINQRYFTPHFKQECNEFLKMIQFAYGNAPYFERTKAMVEDVFSSMDLEETEENIADKIARSIKQISDFLGLTTHFETSSHLEKDASKSGQELILEINRALQSRCYINPKGGRSLYNRQRFEEEDIKLRFLKSQNIEYQQFSDDFVPSLSIIDVCMFNSRDEIRELLNAYSIIK